MKMTQEKKIFKLLTGEEYAKMFITFKSKTDEDTIIRNAVLKPMIENYGDRSIDIMSIGAGKGWLEDEIIRHPQMKVKSILAIEPNPEHAMKLRETSLQWTKTTVNIDQSYFDENYETAHTFDVILIIHSIYYFENAIDAIIKLKSILNPGGQIMLAVEGEKGGNELASHVYGQNNNVLPTCSFNWIAGEFLVRGLKSNNLKFKLQTFTSVNDVTDFIERKDTPSCNDTVSFFLNTKYEDLDKELQDDIYKMVKDRAIVTKDNKKLFPEDNTFITVENI